MKKTRSQRTLIGRDKNAFYWLRGERAKLQRRTQLQRYKRAVARSRRGSQETFLTFLLPLPLIIYQCVFSGFLLVVILSTINSVDPLRVSALALNGACSSKGSPSSKYGHRRTSASLRNIRNIRICMGKNLSFP